MKNKIYNIILTFFILLILLGASWKVQAVNYYGKNGQAPNVLASWGNVIGGTGTAPTNFTTITDNFIIEYGVTMRATSNWTVGSLLRTVTLLQINFGGTLETASTYTMNILGPIKVGGTFTLAGTGTKTFDTDVLLDSGAVWNETGVAQIIIKGNLKNNATIFTANTGLHTFAGNYKTFSGSRAIIIPSVSLTGLMINIDSLTIGTALSALTNIEFINAPLGTLSLGGTLSINIFTNGGNMTFTGTTITTTVINNGTLNLQGSGAISGITNSNGGTVNLISSGTINTFTNGNACTLNILALTVPTIGNLTVTAAGNVVNYCGAGAQTVKAVQYINLTFSGSGAKAIAAGVSVLNKMSIAPDAGLATANIAAGVTVAARSLFFGGYNQVIGDYSYALNGATYFANTTGIITAARLSPFVASVTGAWSATGTWGTYGVPTVNDDVVINADVSTLSTLTTSGSITINSGSSLTSSFTINAGNLIINSGGSLTNNNALNISGYTDVTGTITLNGTSTFNGNVTLNSNSSYNQNSTQTLHGNFTNNASTFNTGIAITTDYTGIGIISGITAINNPNTIFSGCYINTNTITASSSLSNNQGGFLLNSGTININGTCSLGNAVNFCVYNTGMISVTGSGAIRLNPVNLNNRGTINLGGSGSILGITNDDGGIINLNSSGTISTLNNKSNATLNIFKSPTVPTITIFYITAFDNTVNYSGVAQTVLVKSYNNLTLSGSGAKTLGATTTILGNLSISGTAVASLTGNITAETLTLDGSGKINGTWGSSTSLATNQTNTYFTSNGTVNVLTDTRPALTITANNGSKTYGQTFTTGTGSTNFTSTGLLNGETIGTITIASIGAASSATVGSFTIVPSAATGGTFTASNYNITYTNGTLTVGIVPLTITGLTGVNKTYDGLTSASLTGTAALSGVVSGDVANVTLSGTPAYAFADAAVGATKAITASGFSISGTASGNYSLSQPTGLTANITAAPITVTASAQIKNYESTAPTSGTLNTHFTVTGLQNSDAASGSTLAYSGSPEGNLTTAVVGSYTIIPSALTLSSGSTSNYSITYNTGTLTVNAVTNNWTGGTGNWNTDGNWSLNRVPSSLNDNITVNSGSPALDVNYTLGTGRTLTISNTGVIIINSTSSITIAGTADFGSKLVTLKSDASGTAAIGTITGTLSNATNVTVERYIPAIGRKWRFLASPLVGGSTLQWRDNAGNTSGRGTQITGSSGTVDASLSNSNSAFYYNETLVGGTITDYSKWPNIDGNNSLTNGKGYRIFVRGDRTINLTANPQSTVNNPTTLWINGSYPSNPVTLPITYTAGGGIGWNLVGNPYPCTIDWDLVKAQGSTSDYNNISDAIYIWHPLNTNYNSGGYTSYVSGIGSGTPNVGTRYISSSQGFMVKATGSSPVLKIYESHKVSAQQGAKIFKNTDEPSHMRLKLSIDTIQFDDAVIHFTEGATKNFDRKYDAFDMTQGIGFLTADLKDTLAINGFPKLHVNDVAKIYINNLKTGKYKIMFSDMSTFDNNFDAYLIDHYLNKNTLIKEDVIYSFNLDTNNLFTSGGTRFEIVFGESKTSYENILNRKNETQLSVYPNPATDVLNINISNANFKNSKVMITNVSGQQLINTNMIGDNAQLNIESLSNGVYFVTVSNEEGFNKTVKFVK